MANVKFILKEPKSKEDTLVYLFCNYHYKRFKYSTGEKINPKFWNFDKQRAKETKNYPEHPEFNERLKVFRTGVNNVFRRLLNNGVQPTNELLKSELEKELSEKVLKHQKVTLFSFADSFIEDSKSVKTAGTIKNYNNTLRHLKNYAEAYNKRVDFDTIDLTFYSSFLKYLGNDLGLSNNSIGNHIKTLKTFLNEATERGFNENFEFKKRKFKKIQEESDTVYLSEDELKLIENTDFSSKPRLEKVRDLFLIGCYTGLRFSDFSQIKKENIDSEKAIIQVRTQKTKDKVYIPIHPVVKRILSKYNGAPPKAYTNQVMNKHLKEVALFAKIKTPIEVTSNILGSSQKSVVPKYKLVCTHTARRSFATNCYLADIPAISIMKITGHKTEKSFLRYIRVTQEQNADKLLTHPFFK